MLPAPGPFGEVVVEKFEKRMMNFNELADSIGLRPQTIRNKFYAGEFPIPAKKIFAKVLWDKKDVDKYLDKLPKIDC
jgi:predicted DNA-binding transcriptional regulator AlpA